MKFSVTIPAYKARFLKECIESILSQTYKDFELIIVNDASPEDLTSIVKSFDDPRIRYYVNEKNCGAINVVDNWNKCLDYATGEYIICMGDDDKLLPNCLEEYVKLINKYPNLNIYHAWTEIIDENSNAIEIQEGRPEREGVYSMIWSRWNGRIQFIGDFLFNRKILKDNGGFYKLPLAWSSDDISTFIAAKDTGIANMQTLGFQYRSTTETISRSNDNFKYKLLANIQEEEWYRLFLKNVPKHTNKVEYIFWEMLVKHLSRRMMKVRIYTISRNMANNGLYRVFDYFVKRKEYRLNFPMIGYAFIEAIRIRILH